MKGAGGGAGQLVRVAVDFVEGQPFALQSRRGDMGQSAEGGDGVYFFTVKQVEDLSSHVPSKKGHKDLLCVPSCPSW